MGVLHIHALLQGLFDLLATQRFFTDDEFKRELLTMLDNILTCVVEELNYDKLVKKSFHDPKSILISNYHKKKVNEKYQTLNEHEAIEYEMKTKSQTRIGFFGIPTSMPAIRVLGNHILDMLNVHRHSFTCWKKRAMVCSIFIILYIQNNIPNC